MRPRYISLDPLIPWKQVSRPLDLVAIFGRMAPVTVEIGFGSGDYLVKQAIDRPQEDFIGVELSWLSIKNALRRIALSGVSNVRLIQGDARVVFRRLFSDNSFDTVYSLFPCPWPKKRHVKHRLFNTSFLQLLNSRLKSHGAVMVVTDYRPYRQWVIEQAQGCGFEISTDSSPPSYRTKYEKKWQDQGQKEFFRIRLKKVSHIQIPLEEDVVLKTHVLEHFSPEHFRPKGGKNIAVVEFKETLYDPLREKAMVRAMVAEGGFVQNFWIEIIKNGSKWRVRPARGCSIVPTAGVQEALDLVYGSAKAQRPGGLD